MGPYGRATYSNVMITFLRKIRRTLIESGSARRYLLYAIGEIALVVIGILIALQINKWNETRKDRVQETKTLENLAENMELNIDRINKRLTMISEDNRSGRVILDALKNKNSNVDSIGLHFHHALLNHARLVFSKAGYEALKNTGFDIIRNESLRKEIINLYENTYIDLSVEQVWGQTVEPDNDMYVVENFFMYEGGSWLPKNFEKVSQSDYFYGLVNVADRQRFYYGGLYNETLLETLRVLQLIKDELGD